MNVPRVHLIGKAIEDAIKTHAYGTANSEALREITQLADAALNESGRHPYVSEKISSLKSFAAVLYSQRKHQQYAQAGQDGAERVRSILLQDAYRLAHWSPPNQAQ